MRDKRQERGEYTIFDVKREEVGRIRLAKGIELVIYKAGDHLDMRLWVDRLPYKGLSFFIPEGIYEELKELIERVDGVCQGKPEAALTVSEGPGEHTPNENAETLRKVGCKI